MNTGPHAPSSLKGLSEGLSAQISGSPQTSSSSQSLASLSILNVSITLPSRSSQTSSSGTSTSPLTQIFFDTTRLTYSINQFCSPASNCLCSFSWNETNALTNPPMSYQREVQTPLTSVQTGLVNCPGPQVYDTEIPDQTNITIKIIPSPSSSASFQTSHYVYVKNGNQSSSQISFQDIFHYTCFQKINRGMSFYSKQFNTSSGSSTAKSAYASQFCTTSAQATGGTSGDNSCPQNTIQQSTQSAYYHLYIPGSEKGNINLSNVGLECPQVLESLDTQTPYWPMDSQFRLSQIPTSTFNVGVLANSVIDNGGTPSTTCAVSLTGTPNNSSANSSTPSPSAQSTSGGLVSTCLGYASSANTDGSCPLVQDVNEQWVQTYRLRRYTLLYPSLFDTSGEPFNNMSQNLDTLYVLDRPVQTPPSQHSSSSAAYSMLGPKPCPFAYFDWTGTAASSPQYVSAGDPRWRGKNKDGIYFPNQDGLINGVFSCSTILPLLTFSNGIASGFTLKTLRATEKLYTRPTGPFIPHYEEDLSFQACAPLSQEFREAPLHFALEPQSKNVSWCSEAYPTVNPLISYAANASQINHTSHTVGTVVSHRTMNRNALTGSPDSASSSATPLPLLSPSASIESEIIQDKSFQCLITYEGGQTVKIGLSTPSSGCCQPTTSPVITGNSRSLTGHLEPSVPCGLPLY